MPILDDGSLPAIAMAVFLLFVIVSFVRASGSIGLLAMFARCLFLEHQALQSAEHR